MEIIGEYGGVVGGGDLYSDTEAGVPIAIWDSWMPQTQDKYLEDYYRTEAQQNYALEQSDWYNVAYAYTGIVDHYTGLEAVEIGETTNEYIEVVQENLPRALNLAGEGALLLGLGAIALLLRKK